MIKKKADDFFDNVNFTSIVDTVKGIMTSDGSMSILLDFERVLDDADVYAFKNWINGELVQGPEVGRYTVTCMFMWPYKLMPDPAAAKRLLGLGCKIKFKKTKIKVPIEVKNYEDYIPGTRYPRAVNRQIWLVSIEIPLELMDDIKEGSIDLEDQTIDLDDIDDAYDEDLEKEGIEEEPSEDEMGQSQPMPGAGPGAAPTL